MKEFIQLLKRRHLVYRYARTRTLKPLRLFGRYRLQYLFKRPAGEWRREEFIRPGFWFYIPRRKMLIGGVANDLGGCRWLLEEMSLLEKEEL